MTSLSKPDNAPAQQTEQNETYGEILRGGITLGTLGTLFVVTIVGIIIGSVNNNKNYEAAGKLCNHIINDAEWLKRNRSRIQNLARSIPKDVHALACRTDNGTITVTHHDVQFPGAKDANPVFVVKAASLYVPEQTSIRLSDRQIANVILSAALVAENLSPDSLSPQARQIIKATRQNYPKLDSDIKRQRQLAPQPPDRGFVPF